MLEYMVNLPFPGVPLLITQVEAYPECWYNDGPGLYKVREGKLYEQSATEIRSTGSAAYGDEHHHQLPVEVVAVAAIYESYDGFDIVLELGRDGQIYDVFGEVMTPERIENWFGDEEHVARSSFYS